MGDYGVGYFGTDVKDPEEKARKLNVELNNGRAAMMGIIGNMVAEKLTGQTMYEQNEFEQNADRFTVEQIQKYVRYARTIKPKISEDSKKWFVRYYRQLRQRDQSEQKAYRFTVRQLESLIRLSEALARLHCDSVVSPKYVKEAARLLKKSIISVDSEDVPLSDPL